jgi:hypothetical protein
VRRAAALAVVLLLGLLASFAIPGRSAVPQLTITTTPLPISTTLPVTTALPKVTTTLPVTTTIPKVTTTLPVTTTIPKITTTLPVTTAIPKVTTTIPKVTTTIPEVTTAPLVTTVLPTTTGVVSRSSSPNGGAVLFSSTASGSSAAQPGAASAGLFTASGGGSAAGSAPVTRLRTPRPFLSLHGPKARRVAILVFKLRHAARVRFTVVEVFPACRVIGSFTVRGHAGVNRLRFNGRVQKKRLRAGTYQIGLHTRRGRLLRVTIAIFDGPVHSSSAVAAAKQRNVCRSTAAFSPFSGLTLWPPIAAQPALALPSSTGSNVHHVLGVDVTAPREVLTKIGKNPFALVALGLAVLLLAAAAVPQAATPRGRAADLLVRERSTLVLAGAVALAVGVLIVALT